MYKNPHDIHYYTEEQREREREREITHLPLILARVSYQRTEVTRVGTIVVVWEITRFDAPHSRTLAQSLAAGYLHKEREPEGERKRERERDTRGECSVCYS